jgi:PAS domain S-box-containing protein
MGKMSSTDHYLKNELDALMKRDHSIFKFFQDGSLDGVWYWDLENPTNEWMSRRFWITLGYDPEEKKHLASEWQTLIHPDDLAVALENFEKHCSDPSHPYDQVVRYRHKNGSTVWVRCRGIAIRDEKR